MRTYTQASTRATFLARAEYLMLRGGVGQETFGAERYLNQMFYASRAWKSARDVVIIRDNGCDLGIPGHEIHDKIIVHHINPITPAMLKTVDDMLFDPENLISVSNNTHQAIHYGDGSLLPKPILERKPGDHILWERKW